MSCMNRTALFTGIAAVVASSPLQQCADLSCFQNAAETIAAKTRSHRRLANTFKEVPPTGTDSVRRLADKKIDEPETWARTVKTSAEPARNSAAQTAVTEAIMAEPKTATTVATTSTVVSTPTLFFEDVPTNCLLASVNSYTESRDWSMGSGCTETCKVQFRCYILGERDPETLWNDICKKTGNSASYGYVDGDGKRLYVIFEKGGVFKADNMACGFDTAMLADFNIIGWTTGNRLVLKAQNATGRTVAIKAFPAINEVDNYTDMLCEWDIMRAIEGIPNVSQPLSLERYNGNGYLVSSWAGKPLSELTAEYKENHSRCGEALHQLLLQLKRLRRLGIGHRDIKPSNMTLTDTGKVTLIDFGKACLGKPIHDIAGTDGYMAPECFEQLGKPTIEQYDRYAADMYSLGITMCELFLGDSKKPCLPTESSVDSALSDLVHQMCHEKPSKRITATAALKHKYFKLLDIGSKRKSRVSRTACELVTLCASPVLKPSFCSRIRQIAA